MEEGLVKGFKFVVMLVALGFAASIFHSCSIGGMTTWNETQGT